MRRITTAKRNIVFVSQKSGIFLRLAIISAVALLPKMSSADPVTVLTMNSAAKPPLSTEFNDGFIDLLAIEAMSRIHVKLNIVQLPAERALQDDNNGILDGELLRVAGLEKTYTNLVPVDEKLMDLKFVAFSRKIKQINDGWKSLKPYSVAFMNGWKILEKNVPAEAEITKVNSHSQLFNLLDIDRVDIVIYERWGGLRLIQDLNIANVHALKPALATSSMHMYLNKKYQNLVPKIDEALKKMKTDGTYNKIYEKTLKKYKKD